jgi:insertion element IS1 protein InsB
LPKIAQKLVNFSKEKCEESPDIECPACGSQHIIKNGFVHNGKQKYHCKSCSRQFVNNPTKVIISIKRKQFIDRLLLERISLRGIARVTQVSWS